jgi:hypothetical protein
MEEAGTIFWPPAVTFGACLAFGKKRDHSYVAAYKVILYKTCWEIFISLYYTGIKMQIQKLES